MIRVLHVASRTAVIIGLLATCSVVAASGDSKPGDVQRFSFGGRDVDMYIPATAPSPGARALLVVLHGGMGNSVRSRDALQMDAISDRYGLLIAYLNGSPTRRHASMRTWNAGTCCGQAQRANVDDVGYVTATIHAIEMRYGVKPDRVFGMGHSNGAMMTLRVMCETGIYQAAVAISGPLELQTSSCPAARGRRILAIHGADDQNVPVAGGRGQGIAGVSFRSEAESGQIFENSGASCELRVIPGADHKLDSIRAATARSGGSLGEEVVRFLGVPDTH